MFTSKRKNDFYQKIITDKENRGFPWQKNSSLIFIIPCVKWNYIFQNVQKRGQAHKLHENPNFWEFPTKNFCFIWFSLQHLQTSVELVNAFQNFINFHIFHNFLKTFLSAPFVPIKKLKTFKCYTNLDILWLSWTSIVSILALFTTEYDAALKLKALSSIDRKLELNNETDRFITSANDYVPLWFDSSPSFR